MQLLSLCGRRDRGAHTAATETGKQDGRNREERAGRKLWKL